MMWNWLKHPHKCIAMLLGSVSLFTSQTALAIQDEAVLLLTEPIDTAQVIRYWQGEVPADGSIITEGTISQTSLTPPSLWWTQEQFGNDLLDFWVAYPGINGELRRVDLIVNRQNWLRATYLQRYTFLHHFGTSASDFAYNTRVYDWQGDLLGVYVCEFESGVESIPLQTPPSDCRVFLDTFGLGIFASPTPTGGLGATPVDIGQ